MTTARKPNQLRPVKIEPYPTAAPGSVMITQGRTQILCTASVSTELPRWLQAQTGAKPGASKPSGGSGGQPQPPAKGWVTAEYAMLPGSTPQRKERRSDGRASEIQRLIGRVLRVAVDLERMPGVQITCDCDVIVADGGTRTAAITGGCVALAQALAWAKRQGFVTPGTAPGAASVREPFRGPVAAVSVGIIDGRPYLDLDYALDVRAEVDLNVAMDHRGRFVEVQGTAEGATFSRAELDELLNLAGRGIRQLLAVQKDVLREV